MHEGTRADGRWADVVAAEAAALEAAGVEPASLVALVRAGVVLDPLGRTADQLADEHNERVLAARGFSVLRASFGLVRKGAFAYMLAWELAHGAVPLPAELVRLEADDEFAARMRALEQQSARVEGERRALMAAHVQRAVDGDGDAAVAVRELASIAAVELGLSRQGMERRMTDAWEIVTGLPAAHEAAAAGRITVSHLWAIEAETRAVRHDGGVSPEERSRVVRELVAIAETTSPGRLRRRAKRVVDAVLERPLQQRHDRAMERRRVEVIDAGDGMSDVVARVPSVLAAGILDRLSQAARGKPKEDPRSFDQFRADAFCEALLAGTTPDDAHALSALKAQVSVLIPATELLESGGEQLCFPASLDGRVLVDGTTARRLARGEAMWERLFTDPVSGVAVTVDGYRPSAEQRRWLAARDGGCRFVHCSCSGRRADVDHTVDWAQGGATSIDNLATLCRSDHMLKHASRWQVRQLERGVLEWTSPLGRVVLDEPEPIGPIFAEPPRRHDFWCPSEDAEPPPEAGPPPPW